MRDFFLIKLLFFTNKCKLLFHRGRMPPYLAEYVLTLMAYTLHSASLYPEIIIHANLDLMTRLTEYTSPAKQEAKIEAQRSNAEVRVLQKQSSS